MPAALTYPTLLPAPLVAGYNYTESPHTITTEMDSGYRTKRKRFTSVPSTFNLQLILDQSTFGYFESWYSVTLDYGVNWFNLDLAVGDSIATSHECRILGEPKKTLASPYWRVSFKVEALSLQLGITYDDVMLGVIETLGGFAPSSTYLDKLDVAINVTYPDSGYNPA